MKCVKDIGERELIRRIWNQIRAELRFTAIPNTFDDAVAFESRYKYIVMTNDGINEKTDKLPGMSWHDFGWRLGVMCVSDLIAKGAIPLGMLISLNIPKSLEIKAVEMIYEGLIDSAKEYCFELWGGDMGEASEVTIDGFMVGYSTKKPIFRKGMKLGDYVLTTGKYGLTGAAFHYLLKGGIAVSENTMHNIIQAAYKPRVKLRMGVLLANTEGITASIDSSDGLAESLYQLAEINGLGILIHNIPIADEALEYANTNNLDVKELALYGGEEYEVVFSVRPEAIDEVLENMKKNNIEVHIIGKVIERKGVFIQKANKTIPIERRGWEHYSKDF